MDTYDQTVPDSREPRRLLTVEQARERLQISRGVIYRLINSGELRSICIGQLRRIPVEALDEFVARELAASQPDDAA
jgi:excisionase family DNA binding protein